MGPAEKTLNVGTYRQKTNYTCGPGALKLILDFYGRNFSEKILTKIAGTNKKQGTSHEGLAFVLNKLGYKWVQKEFASIKDIEFFIRKKIPVLVDYQSWHGGHYSVIRGYTRTHFLLSDTAKNCGYRTIRKDLFYKRWYDTGHLKGLNYHRWMLVVLP